MLERDPLPFWPGSRCARRQRKRTRAIVGLRPARGLQPADAQRRRVVHQKSELAAGTQIAAEAIATATQTGQLHCGVLGWGGKSRGLSHGRQHRACGAFSERTRTGAGCRSRRTRGQPRAHPATKLSRVGRILISHQRCPNVFMPRGSVGQWRLLGPWAGSGSFGLRSPIDCFASCPPAPTLPSSISTAP